MRQAMESGHAEDLERIPLGGYLKLANPYAALAFELAGPDSHQMAMPPPPRFDSEDFAGEIVELYWKALLRDLPFAEYETSELARRAAAELTSIGAFCGPRRGSDVTLETVCRGGSRGGMIGPYVSQFLYRDIPFSPMRVPQKIRTTVRKREYLTDLNEWLAIQNGAHAGVNAFDISWYPHGQ